jgi:hypothetical protein
VWLADSGGLIAPDPDDGKSTVAVNGRIVRLVATRPISVGHGVDAEDQQVVAPVGGQEAVVPDGSRVMGAGCGKGVAQAEETADDL